MTPHELRVLRSADAHPGKNLAELALLSGATVPEITPVVSELLARGALANRGGSAADDTQFFVTEQQMEIR